MASPGEGVVIGQLAGSAGVGGGERYLALLMARLSGRGFHPTLVCPEAGPFVGYMSSRGVPARVVSLTPLGNPLPVLQLARHLRREGVQVLQTHGARSTFYGSVAGHLAGVPVIVATLHNWIGDYEVGARRRWLYQRMLAWALRRTDRVICVSAALKAHAIHGLGVPPGRCDVVYNGIDLQQARTVRSAAATREDLKAGTGPLLLSVGRLTEQKGHRYLIEALPGLAKDWPELRCVIVGDGELKAELMALAARSGVGSRCAFVGTRHDVPDLMAAADLVVLPSVSEGCPFVLLEALALAKPVAATRIEGVMELIVDRETGRLAPARDGHALGELLREMLRDSAGCQRMGEAGRNAVARRWTIEHLVDRTLAVFDAVWREKFGVGLPTWVTQ